MRSAGRRRLARPMWPAATGAPGVAGGGGRVLEPQRRRARPVCPAAAGACWSGQRLLTGRATARVRGGGQYVRARITQPDGKRAWTQAHGTVA
ncbi:hypothetical protein [Sorangium sp. So ce1335]|uniref:hypothetical protein n=1 Tax=Sorangium sp. So ce1335 TaxID=3133335 RepID=UPI003F613DED